MPRDDRSTYAVDDAVCIRCASCATLAPGVFRLTPSGIVVLRAPHDEAERQRCEAAVVNCPTGAVRHA